MSSGPVKITGTFEIIVSDGEPKMKCEVFVDNSAYKTNRGFLDELNDVMMGLKAEFGGVVCDHAFPDKQRDISVARLLTATLFRKFGPIADAFSPETSKHIEEWLRRKGLGALLTKVKNRGKTSLLQAIMELPEARESYGDVLDRLGCADSAPVQEFRPKSRMQNYGDN